MSKSPAKISPGQSKHYIANLFAVLSKLEPGRLMLLYGDLFTESEALMLAKRLEIACALLAGQSYLKIQKQLGVTANTVAQIQKVLKRAGSGFRFASKLLAGLKQSKPAPEPHPGLAPQRKRAVSLPAVKKNFFNSVFTKVFHSAV